MTLRESIRGLVSDPSLRDRLLWRDPMRAETMITEDRGLIARTYGTLFSLGGVAGLILLASGRATEDADWALAAASLTAVLIGLVCLVGYRRLPIAAFQWMTVLATAIITVGAVIGATGTEGVTALFYVWVALVSSLFFRMRVAALQIGLAVGAFTVVLMVRDADFIFNYAVGLLFVLSTSGFTITLLRARIESLASSLAADASTDALTGLSNRRGFDQRFQLETDRAERSRAPLSLVICDLDRFKDVNDELGHEEGDAALRRAAATIAGSVRSIDAVSRLGGEEFSVLLPEAGTLEAFEVAERVRGGVLAEFADDPVALTASCGVATLESDDDARSLFQHADAALYRAKAAGRNRTMVYEDPSGELAASSTK